MGTAPTTAAEARAEAEARRSALRAERESAFAEVHGDLIPGRWVMAGSWSITAVFLAVAAGGVVAPDALDGAFLVVSLVFFLIGCLLFAVDLVLAAQRSRSSEMGIAGIFFLVGSAPSAVQRQLLGSLSAQVVVSLVAAAVGFARLDDQHLNTLAFGILVPMAGLGACGYWAVRWGLFPDRVA